MELNFTKITNFSKFIILLSILTVFDYFTTNYLLDNNLGVEGNPTMSSIVSDHLTFALIKSFGVIMIIGLYRTINEKYKDNLQIQKISSIGQRLIILMYFLVIFNNLFVINASAVAFNNLSFGGTGQINTGNGYFDNPGLTFGYTDTRNVYTITEDNSIFLVEPISLVLGSSPTALELINSSTSALTDSVVHQGYLYFIDSGTLKKKKSRNDGSMCLSNDTGVGGCIAIIATGVSPYLRVYNNNIYYIVSNNLKTLDDTDNQQNVLTGVTPATISAITGWTVTSNNSVLTFWEGGRNTAGGSHSLYRCTSVTCDEIHRYTEALGTVTGTMFTLVDYQYFLQYNTGVPSSREYIQLNTNSTSTNVDYATTDLSQNNRIYVGGETTIGLFAYNTTMYQTFTSAQVGSDSIVTVPADLIYTTKTIQSLKTEYYNTSNIFIKYDVGIDNTDLTNLVQDLGDYRWIVAMTDPNGVSTDVAISSECTFPALSFTCGVHETWEFSAPSAGWLQGTWNAELYELNIVTNHRALIASSNDFEVLNTTIENQSTIPPGTQPITSGSSPTAIASIDQMVAWLGLGVNSVSKLLFAMIWVAAFGAIGLFKSNGNVAMALSFVPYGFFTFIEYIPKWMFVIYIILLAIVSKAFR